LQDDVPTFGNDIAFRIVEEELGQKFVDVFELIEPEPIAGEVMVPSCGNERIVDLANN
jgi:hypothetical protein